MRAMRRLLLLLAPVASLLAQADEPRNAGRESQAVFRADTNLVLVRFQWDPKSGQPSSLRPEDIELSEDGVPQKVAVLQGGESNPQSVPVEVNLLFTDIRPIVEPRTLDRFDLSRMDDHGRVSVAVWAIGANLVRITGPTRDGNTLNRAMSGLFTVWSDQTARPALFTTIAALAREAARGRTNVVRFLAVVYNGSPDRRSLPEEAIRAARDSGCTVLAVHVNDNSNPSPVPNLVWAQSMGTAMRELDDVVKATYGRSVTISYKLFGDRLEPILKWLGKQIRADHVAGFYPAASGARKPHNIQVTLKDGKRGRIRGGTRTIEY
jgi:hypothetical protein